MSVDTELLPRREGRPGLLERKLDVAQALKLRLTKNLSYEAIGILLDPDQPFCKQAVHQALADFTQFIENPELVNAAAEQYSGLLDAAKLRLLRSVVDEEAIKKGSLKERATAFGILDERSRLERGQSTGNIGLLGRLVVESAKDLFVRPVDRKKTTELPENQNQSVSNVIETQTISDNTDVHS